MYQKWFVALFCAPSLAWRSVVNPFSAYLLVFDFGLIEQINSNKAGYLEVIEIIRMYQKCTSSMFLPSDNYGKTFDSQSLGHDFYESIVKSHQFCRCEVDKDVK